SGHQADINQSWYGDIMILYARILYVMAVCVEGCFSAFGDDGGQRFDVGLLQQWRGFIFRAMEPWRSIGERRMKVFLLALKNIL
ncbi:MAG: hypothetical protein II661_09715, partial [Bacteroidales bacterium]|nr:hypothetical protein [Bacteroidales bacterium]